MLTNDKISNLHAIDVSLAVKLASDKFSTFLFFICFLLFFLFAYFFLKPLDRIYENGNSIQLYIRKETLSTGNIRTLKKQ